MARRVDIVPEEILEKITLNESAVSGSDTRCPLALARSVRPQALLREPPEGRTGQLCVESTFRPIPFTL